MTAPGEETWKIFRVKFIVRRGSKAEFNVRVAQAFRRMPEQAVEIRHPVVLHPDPFLLQHFLHEGRGGKMVASAQFALAVHHPVSGNGGARKGIVQRPAYHAGRPQGQVIGNGAIGANPAVGNAPGYRVNLFVVICLGHTFRFGGCIAKKRKFAAQKISNPAMLRTKFKASAITNLTDARYFAAWNADWLGFCLDPADEAYVAPQVARAIREWIDGPRFVGEFNLQTADEMREAITLLDLDALQAGPFTPEEVLRELRSPVPVIKAWVIEPQTGEAELAAAMEAFAPLAAIHLLDFRKMGADWSKVRQGKVLSPGFLAETCATYRVLLAMDDTPEAIRDMLDALNPEGLSFQGGAEERVGYKSFDELDEILEALED